jgi:hypothetical protein
MVQLCLQRRRFKLIDHRTEVKKPRDPAYKGLLQFCNHVFYNGRILEDPNTPLYLQPLECKLYLFNKREFNLPVGKLNMIALDVRDTFCAQTLGNSRINIGTASLVATLVHKLILKIEGL